MKQLNFVAAVLVASAFLSPQRALASSILSLSGPAAVSNGSSFVVDVMIANAADLYGFQFDLGFNPSVLSATLIGEGPFLSGGGATFFVPGTINNAAGSIAASANTLLSAVSGVNGSGILMAIDFTAIGSGTSAITLSNPMLLDSNLHTLNTSITNASISVKPSTVAAPEVDPARAVGAFTLLAGALAVARGRRFPAVERGAQ